MEPGEAQRRGMKRKTALFKSPLFLAHDPGFDHVESPERLRHVYKILEKKKFKIVLFSQVFLQQGKKLLASIIRLL